MAHIVKCRICKQSIDTDTSTDWVKPVNNMYYHKSCYEDFAKKKKDVYADADNDIWQSILWDYLRYDLKMEINYYKFNSQWNNFIKSGKTGKGIYFALKYFYDIKGGDRSKSQEGIGILPYIYDEGCGYWAAREREEAGLCARIEAQVRERIEQKKIVKLQKVGTKRRIKDADEVLHEFYEIMEDDII